MMRLSYDPIYESGWVGWLLVAALIALLFAITPRGLIRSRRSTLLALRAIASIALILTMLRPSLVRSDNRPSAATLAIAIDGSRSMTLASGADDGNSTAVKTGAENRWQQQLRVLDQIAGGVSSLDNNLNFALVLYDVQSERIAGGRASEMEDSLGVVAAVSPDGPLTDLSAPLESIVASSRSMPLAGIVLLSDGTQTMGSEPGTTPTVDPISSAKLIAAIGVPLWTVSLGPAADAGRLRDVAVQSLPETYRMFTGNETEISFEIPTRGYAGSPVQVSLVWINEGGNKTTAATRTITPTRPEQTQAMTIPVVAPAPGRYRLVAAAGSLAGETDTSNDSQLAFVDVREGGGRVLLLEGTPRLEQRYLRRALRRFPDLELTYRWIPRDTASRWPASLEDDLQPGRYDIIILGDLHSAALGTQQLERLAKLVSEGTALVTLGGERAYGPGGYADSPLAPVLPIEMDDSLEQSPGATLEKSEAGQIPDQIPGQIRGQIPGPIVLKTTRPHPITNIAVDANDDANPNERWSTLPTMPGANEIVGVKTRPGVQVLLENQDAIPMLIVGEYGDGRVASLAFDSTWVWWSGGASEFHRRFWRQLMLWLLSREESEDGKLELELTRRRFSTSERSEFSASISMDEKTELPNERWSAEIELEDGKTVSLATSATTQAGGNRRLEMLRGEVSATAFDGLVKETTADESGLGASGGAERLPPGIHSLHVRLGDKDDPLASATLSFQVLDDTRELVASGADHPLLGRLASITSAAGGESFRADQVDELIERVSSQRRRAESVVIEKWRLGDGPLSGWLVFLFFAGSLCVEWTLRRRWGLA